MRLLLPFVLGFMIWPAAWAQPTGEFGRANNLRTNAPPYYFHLERGGASIQVNVWGTVRYPGLYEVNADTPLDQLLTLAGGPVDTPRDRNTERTVTVRIHRMTGDTRQLLYEAPLNTFIQTSTPYPQLQTGDVVTVDTVERRRLIFTWRDGLTVLTATAAVLVAVVQIINVTR